MLPIYASDFTGDTSNHMRMFERRRVAIRKTKDTSQKSSAQPSSSKKRKGKDPKPNYYTMDSVEYARVGYKD